jgi:hypothetical protein
MDWQQAASLGIVAITAVLFVRGRLRGHKGGARDCCGECGKLETLSRKEYHGENVLNNRGQNGWTPKRS